VNTAIAGFRRFVARIADPAMYVPVLADSSRDAVDLGPRFENRPAAPNVAHVGQRAARETGQLVEDLRPTLQTLNNRNPSPSRL
jgi:hypothetical protein